LFEALPANLRAGIPIIELDMVINDSQLADRAAQELL
jgi:hypothetical protein